MRVTLRQGSKKFEVGKLSGDGENRGIRDSSSAEHFFRGFKNDPAAMVQLRRLAHDVSGFEFHRGGDEPVFRVLAAAVTSGRIGVAAGPMISRPIAPAAEAPAAPAPAPPVPRADASSAPTPREPSIFPADFDAAAQAAALKQAAELGVPFCEECEKRRQKQAAA